MTTVDDEGVRGSFRHFACTKTDGVLVSAGTPHLSESLHETAKMQSVFQAVFDAHHHIANPKNKGQQAFALPGLCHEV